MNFKRIMDSHVHSDNSYDGIDPVMKLCEVAEEKGLDAVTITDHCDIDRYFKHDYDKLITQAMYATAKAKSVFGGRLVVHFGIEMGQPLHDEEITDRVLSMHKYDFVLGAIHSVRGMEDFYHLDYSQHTADELLTKYFEELMRLIEWGKFDSLAHLTYPLKYIIGDHRMIDSADAYDAKFDEVLEFLAKKEKALEINTNGLRTRYGKLFPDFKYVKRFKELGGKLVTVGSDAHVSSDLGAGIGDGFECAKSAGFDAVTMFVRHEPVEIPIITL